MRVRVHMALRTMLRSRSTLHVNAGGDGATNDVRPPWADVSCRRRPSAVCAGGAKTPLLGAMAGPPTDPFPREPPPGCSDLCRRAGLTQREARLLSLLTTPLSFRDI